MKLLVLASNLRRPLSTLRFKQARLNTQLLFLAVSLIGPLLDATAQTSDRTKKIATTMSVINFLLLDELQVSGPVEVNVGGTVGKTFGYKVGNGGNKDGLEIVFNAPNNDLTLCFNAIDIQAGELSAEFNGQSIGLVANGVAEICFDLPASAIEPGLNVFRLVHNRPGERWGIRAIGLEQSNVAVLTLPRVTRREWNTDAVRKVLKFFAFGGHATDNQIRIWADMKPELAIAEMLNFSEHNLKLSPLAPNEKYSQFATIGGTLLEFSEHLASNNSLLPYPLDAVNADGRVTGFRRRFATPGRRDSEFIRMVTTRGLNPFRQMIGYWETNYHLAVSQNPSDGNIGGYHLTRYYDLIMEAHESGVPYQRVLAEAAKSAAIAYQYRHTLSRWDSNSGRCLLCSDDFAREIHQIFFGIFGLQDPLGIDHHEGVTIPQTSRMLTGMPVLRGADGLTNQLDITFNSEWHHTRPLNILNQTIMGNTAAEKIDQLVEYSIEHPESLQNLPVTIISDIADDNLSEQKKNQLRAAWASMGSNKQFLDFIQAYAVSTLFHGPGQRKYATSIERNLYIANKTYLTNTESLLDRMRLEQRINAENVRIFQPLHVVFGGQTSLDAADSSFVFERHMNRSTSEVILYTNSARCIDAEETFGCDFGQDWNKDWGKVIPKTNGVHRVEETARWLWERFVGSTERYGQVERAYLVSLLGGTQIESPERSESRMQDFVYLLCIRQSILNNSDNKDVSLARLRSGEGFVRHCTSPTRNYGPEEQALMDRIYTREEITNTPYIQTLLNELGAQRIKLGPNDPAPQRLFANERIQHAIAFIAATPFLFAEGESQ